MPMAPLACKPFLHWGCILVEWVQDVQMPGGLDGLEATKKIRSMEAAAAAAAATSSPRKTCQEAIRSASALTAAAPSCAPPVRRVPIVGVSACTERDQLKSAALQGLPIDPATGGAPPLTGVEICVAWSRLDMGQSGSFGLQKDSTVHIC